MTQTSQRDALDLFSRYRSVATPLLAYTTPDAPASQLAIQDQLQKDDATDFPGEPKSPVLAYDVIRGLTFVNEEGKQALKAMGVAPGGILNPASVLETLAAKAPPRTLTFFHNAHLFWTGPDKAQFLQGVLNCREPFKTNWRTLVLFQFGGAVPMELERDVVPIEEALPTREVLAEKVQSLLKAGKLDPADEPTLEKATSALAGLSLFAAEQVTSVSLRTTGIDIESMRDRARHQIRMTPGLSVEDGGQTFEGLGGLSNIKRFCSLIRHGEEPPNLIVFMDEIEKQIGGANDLSGISTYYIGQILQEMADTKATGFISYGQPGTGKTEIAKALARELDSFVIRIDLGKMKDKLQGQSEARLNAALRVIRAVGQGRVTWNATSNGLTNLPGELKSRFSLGTFFFDLPTAEERASIWKIHEAAWHLTPEHLKARPDDTDWTGREIYSCCRNAYRLRLTLREAAEFIVPIARSDMETITLRRREAHGRYISASYPGTYRAPGLKTEEAEAEVLVPARAMRSLGKLKES